MAVRLIPMACSTRIRVLFFASVRELVGAAEADMTFFAGDSGTVTIAALLERLLVDHPVLLPRISGSSAAVATSSLEGVSVAVNKRYVRAEAFGDTALRDGDEVAIIPPISGG